jgi:hypothetical protein
MDAVSSRFWIFQTLPPATTWTSGSSPVRTENWVVSTFLDHAVRLPRKLFAHGKGTPSNTHLSSRDKTFIAKMYPRSN